MGFSNIKNKLKELSTTTIVHIYINSLVLFSSIIIYFVYSANQHISLGWILFSLVLFNILFREFSSHIFKINYPKHFCLLVDFVLIVLSGFIYGTIMLIIGGFKFETRVNLLFDITFIIYIVYIFLFDVINKEIKDIKINKTKGKRYLFIMQTDLYSANSNGRTIRDVFRYVKDKNIFSYSISRYNEKLSSEQTFCIDENRLFKLKKIHREADECKKITIVRRIKKNPLTCIIRNMLWSISFLSWKEEYKRWIKEVNPDYIVFNPGDFIFMHKLASFTSKYLKKKLIIYNTEDYYFKTYNYLHDENGFKNLYKYFRKMLVNAYIKSFNSSRLVIHCTDELKVEYNQVFDNLKHVAIYHPSELIGNIENNIFEKQMYYCGYLDKGRDAVLISVANILYEIDPEFIIEVNSNTDNQTILKLQNCKNIKYSGFVPYNIVKNKITKSTVLLGLNSLNQYHLIDKRHAFSTKSSDYIASFNIIFYVGLPNDEFNAIKNNNLGFVSDNLNDVRDNLLQLCLLIQNKENPFKTNMINFYNRYLKSEKINGYVKRYIEQND